MILMSGSPGVVPGPAVSTSPKNLAEMQILGPPLTRMTASFATETILEYDS